MSVPLTLMVMATPVRDIGKRRRRKKVRDEAAATPAAE
jgi:hypothetical protein